MAFCVRHAGAATVGCFLHGDTQPRRCYLADLALIKPETNGCCTLEREAVYGVLMSRPSAVLLVWFALVER